MFYLVNNIKINLKKYYNARKEFKCFTRKFDISISCQNTHDTHIDTFWMKRKRKWINFKLHICEWTDILLTTERITRVAKEEIGLSSFPERVNPALVRPTIDHAQTVGECNSPIGWGSPSRVPQELGSQSQLGCLCATIEPRVYLPPHPSTSARHIVARARACRRVHIHTYVGTSRWDVPARPYERDESHPCGGGTLESFRATYVERQEKKRTRGKKGEGRRDDSLEERRETRPGTHASRDVDAAPRLYDGAYSHTRKTHRRTHGIREQTARYYAQSVGRRLGPDDTPRRYAIALTHWRFPRLRHAASRRSPRRWHAVGLISRAGRRRASTATGLPRSGPSSSSWQWSEARVKGIYEGGTKRERGRRKEREKERERKQVGERGRGLQDATGGPDSERWQERGPTVLDKASVKRRGLIGTPYVIGTLKRASRLKRERETCDRISLLTTRWTCLGSFPSVLDISSWSNPWLRLPRGDEL